VSTVRVSEQREVWRSPGFASIWIEGVVLDGSEQHEHCIVRILRVGENIAALLQVHTRYTVPVRVSVVCTERYRGAAYNRLPCRRSAIGATGSTMVWHAFDTSTSRICLRLMRFKLDFEPSVATSLSFCQYEGFAAG
jgi:hypothetical protein